MRLSDYVPLGSIPSTNKRKNKENEGFCEWYGENN